MDDVRRFTVVDLILALAVVIVAAGARTWFLSAFTDRGSAPSPLKIQDPQPLLTGLPAGTLLRGHEAPTELDALAHNLRAHHWFGSMAPLALVEEQTAHVAPGYPWLLGLADGWLGETADRAIRWSHNLLGTLTALCYCLFARSAFQSRVVAGLAGLLCALHPCWVINVAEIDDGVVVTFLLALCLWLGSISASSGGPFVSLLYGLSLAGLALVRAALLPFAIVSLLWFLFHSRDLKRGWLCGLLAFLGFVNGQAAWSVRNYQVFHEVIPVVDSTYLHLWIGNNPRATGGPLSEETMSSTLSQNRLEQLQALTRQPDRYAALGQKVLDEIRQHPAETLQRRLRAFLCFWFGERGLTEGRLWWGELPSDRELPVWLSAIFPALLSGSLLVMLILGAIGWRWTHVWRSTTMPAALAVIWIPIPYVLGHAEAFHGPRLPLDGVLLCYTAFVVACVVPTTATHLFRGPPGEA